MVLSGGAGGLGKKPLAKIHFSEAKMGYPALSWGLVLFVKKGVPQGLVGHYISHEISMP